MFKSGLSGVTTLFIANLICKIVGAIYRIPLANYLGAEGIGLYQMAFPVYSFLLTFITGGVSTALSKKVALERARGNVNNARYHFFVAKKLCLLYGIIFFIVLLVAAYPLSLLQGNINAMLGYFAIAIGFIFACLLGAYRGYYQGYCNMIPTAVSQVIEQIAKLVLGLIFASVLIKYGTIYGVFGALLGVSISEILSYIYFLIKQRKIQKVKARVNESFRFFKQVLPISISFGIVPLSSLVDSFLIVNLLTFSGFTTTYSTSLYGIESGMILPLINMPNVLISAIAISMLPNLSYKKESEGNISQSVGSIIKSVYIIILPCCIGIFFLADNIINIIYPTLTLDMARIATTLLQLSVFEMFFMCFVTITNSILQAIGKAKYPMYFLIIGMSIKICLSIVLVSIKSINIYGLIIANIFGYFIICFLNILKIKKTCYLRLNFYELLFPIIAGVVMTFTLLAGLKINSNISIFYFLALVVICAFVYFLTLFITKQVSFNDIKKLVKGNKIN